MNKELVKLKKKKSLDKVKKAKLSFAIKRRTHIFIGILISFAIILYLFFVFFFLCEINFTVLWILVAFMLFVPLIVHKAIDFLEYHEQERIIRLEELADTHFQQVKNLIEMENSNIKDIEKEIRDKIAELSEKESFKKILSEYPKLEELYLKVISLYEDYREKKSNYKDEEKLTGDIYDLANNDNFVELSNKSPSVKLIYDELLLLYGHYEEKQELYEELAKAEEDFRKRFSKSLNKNNNDTEKEVNDDNKKSNKSNKSNIHN
ncbi:hypothetical protein ACFLTH_17605 [Bacteroidota bacterium]